jgi:uncharacterized protein with HEPN domain
MAAMRDKVAHGYFGVDLAIVWETATRDVPVIRSAIERIAREPREVGR